LAPERAAPCVEASIISDAYFKGGVVVRRELQISQEGEDDNADVTNWK
jgi:hypothetical protein